MLNKNEQYNCGHILRATRESCTYVLLETLLKVGCQVNAEEDIWEQ